MIPGVRSDRQDRGIPNVPSAGQQDSGNGRLQHPGTKTAALQLFTHLEGEALNVALLMPEDKRDSREFFLNIITLRADWRREFDSVVHHDGEDPAAFAMELEILAYWFILGQRSCELRRHLDSVPPDTPIRDIVDRCRVWESHSGTKRRLTSPALGPEVPVTVVHSETLDSSPYRREWDPIVPDRSTDPGATVNCELLPMLVAYLQQSVHQHTPAALVRDTSPVSSPDVVALLPKDEITKGRVDTCSLN